MGFDPLDYLPKVHITTKEVIDTTQQILDAFPSELDYLVNFPPLHGLICVIAGIICVTCSTGYYSWEVMRIQGFSFGYILSTLYLYDGFKGLDTPLIAIGIPKSVVDWTHFKGLHSILNIPDFLLTFIYVLIGWLFSKWCYSSDKGTMLSSGAVAGFIVINLPFVLFAGNQNFSPLLQCAITFSSFVFPGFFCFFRRTTWDYTFQALCTICGLYFLICGLNLIFLTFEPDYETDKFYPKNLGLSSTKSWGKDNYSNNPFQDKPFLIQIFLYLSICTMILKSQYRKEFRSNNYEDYHSQTLTSRFPEEAAEQKVPLNKRG